MVHDQQGGGVVMQQRQHPAWPPHEHYQGSGLGFMAKCAQTGGREIEWPPRDEFYGSNPAVNSIGDEQQGPDSDANLTTVYPSNFKLRSEMPVQQESVRVITSQPAFKCTKPIKMRGDSKWPPAGSQEDTSEQEVREFVKPRKQNKDYSGFFAQHALPSSYTGYTAPPGTQHVGYEEPDDTTNM